MSHRILVVDDSPIIRTMVRKAIDMSGVGVSAVLEAGDGREALDVMAREQVDIVFADLNMPHMSGQEMVDRMDAEGLLASIPVVVVSSDRNEQRLAALRERGVRAFVRKPFRPEVFRDVFQDHLGGSASPETPAVQPPAPALIARTLTWTLEEAAFALLEVDEAPAPWTGMVVEATLPFRGPARGTILLATSASFAAELAANLLGLEADEVAAARRAHEAVGELLNIFAGALLERWLGGEVHCAMGVPRLETVSGAAREERHRSASARVTMCGEYEHRLDAAVCVECASVAADESPRGGEPEGAVREEETSS